MIKGNEYDQQAKAVTANVTLWPKPVTVVINRTVLESLTASQQEALRGVGPAVVARQLDFLRGLTEEDRGILCRRGLRFVRASDRDLAGLRRAVQPVYDRLERNPQTRSLLRRIRAMKRETAAAPDAPACSPSDATTTGPASQQATVLDAVYRTSFTREELAASPLLTDPRRGQRGELGHVHAHLAARARHRRPANRRRRLSHVGHLHGERRRHRLQLHLGRERRRDLRLPLEPVPGRAHLQA